MDASFKTIDILSIILSLKFHTIWLITVIYNLKQNIQVNKLKELDSVILKNPEVKYYVFYKEDAIKLTNEFILH